MIEKDNNFVKKKKSNSNFCTHWGPLNHYILAQCVTPLPSTVFVKKLKPWVWGWGQSNNSLNKPLWELENTKQIKKINHYQNN